MLQRLRAARFGHAALLALASAALCGAAGLHDEPKSWTSVGAPLRGAASVSTAQSGGDAGHVCLLCLLYGTAASLTVCTVLTAAPQARAVVLLRRPVWVGQPAVRARDGRAPPIAL